MKIEIPLKVLIIDADKESINVISKIINDLDYVIDVVYKENLDHLKSVIDCNDINTIIIDPFSFGIKKAKEFIFKIREVCPGIVFVLHIDYRRITTDFFEGDGRRFEHYYKIDKSLCISEYINEIVLILFQCQDYLAYSLEKNKIEKLNEELYRVQQKDKNHSGSVEISLDLLRKIEIQLNEPNYIKYTNKNHKNVDFLGFPKLETTDKSCFLVMPYTESWSRAVERIITEICDELKIELIIAKTMEGRFIPNDIWSGITKSKFIIVDITGGNPNVTYELGLADAIGKNSILISQNTDVPFDFLGQRLIVYKNSVDGALLLRDNLRKRILEQ